jgi:hypothetical protein
MLSIGAVGAPEAVHEFKELASLDRVLPDPDILFDIIRMDELRPAPIAELIEPQPGELCPLPVEIIDISIGRGSEDLLRHRLCHEMKALGCLLARYIQHASFVSGVRHIAVTRIAFYLARGTKT